MLTLQTIEDSFISKDIQSEWTQTISQSEFSPEVRSELEKWINLKWEKIKKMSASISDESELRRILSNLFIEYKSNWYSLNTFIQYSLFLSGKPDEISSYRASLLSRLIAFLEGFISAEEIKIINRLLAEPVKKDLRLESAAESSVANTDLSSMEEQLNSLYTEKERLSGAIGVNDADSIIALVKSMEDQLSDLYADTSRHDNGKAHLADSMEAQLNDLYARQSELLELVGTAEPVQIKSMLTSMEDQLTSLYDDIENAVVVDAHQIRIPGARKIIFKNRRPAS